MGSGQSPAENEFNAFKVSQNTSGGKKIIHFHGWSISAAKAFATVRIR